jgi:hypothetical protein
MKHRIAPRVAAVVAGILVTATAAAAFLISAPSAPADRGDGLFVVEKGETLARIAERLADGRYIRSPTLLRVIARLRGTESNFKAGWYRVPPGSSLLRVHDLLVTGSQSLVKLTIPEGWTVSRIAALAEERGITPAAAFEAAAGSAALAAELGVPAKTLEGFLYPDTNFVPAPFPAELLARLMVQTFFERLDAIEPDWRAMKSGEVFDTVTLASIVEREYRVGGGPLIANSESLRWASALNPAPRLPILSPKSSTCRTRSTSRSRTRASTRRTTPTSGRVCLRARSRTPEGWRWRRRSIPRGRTTCTSSCATPRRGSTISRETWTRTTRPRRCT